MGKKNIVIAVSSISGGGKSTVVHKLVELLDNSVALFFDDYETPDTYPKNPAVLLDRGADFNVIKSPLLAQHLYALKSGQPVIHPKTGKAVPPAKHIIFEGPLGRAQHETGQYIDFLVFIDTPLEVGLARRLSRGISGKECEKMSREDLTKQLKSIDWLAENYLAWMRRSYLVQLDTVKPASDLILNWEQSPDDLAKAIINALAEAKLS